MSTDSAYRTPPRDSTTPTVRMRIPMSIRRLCVSTYSHVEGELLLPRDGIPAADLGEPGDPRPDLVAARLLGAVPGQVGRHQRPRSDQAHVAPDDVPELGQLVQAERPQALAEGRRALDARQQPARRVGRLDHRSELVDRERPADETWADLAVEHRAPEADAHEGRDDHDDRRQHDRQGRSGGEVERPLRSALAGGPGRRRAHEDNPMASPRRTFTCDPDAASAPT